MEKDQGHSPEPLWEHPPAPLWVKGVNTLGAGLRRVGVRWPRLDAEAMMAEARRRTGLKDFGDDRFREGLRVLVDAFEAIDNANAFGRLFFREYCTRRLVNRLKIQGSLTRHPEILDVPIRRPLFITGLPRSGTTFLHRLMSEDPAGRTMLLWESMEPAPAPDPATYRTDPRIARACKAIGFLERLAPRLAVAHEMSAETPEEDNDLYAHGFMAGILGFLFDVPDYTRWLNDRPESELVENYRYAKTQLQLLSWKVQADYWVLKSPAHQFSVDALLTVFPDASIVVTHRDPLQVIPSLCSLAAGFRGISTNRLDLRRLGNNITEALAIVGPERVIATRSRCDPSRFFDVQYPQLTADPIGTVRSVCDYFGYDFNPTYESRARAWLAANPQHKHGVHRYNLADFGLDAEIVNRHFAHYLEWQAEHLPQSAYRGAPTPDIP